MLNNATPNNNNKQTNNNYLHHDITLNQSVQHIQH